MLVQISAVVLFIILFKLPVPGLIRGGMVGEGVRVWALGLLATLKVLGNDAGGFYSFSEVVVYPGQEALSHVHALKDEMWYMLEGELIWNLGGRESLGRQGSFIHLPRFVPHSFMNRGLAPARMVLVHVPGGFEQWYLEVGITVHDSSQLPPNVTSDELMETLQRCKGYGVKYLHLGDD